MILRRGGELSAGEEEGAAAGLGDDGDVGDDMEAAGAKVVGDLGAHAGGWADVEDWLRGGAHGVGLCVSGSWMNPAWPT